MVQVLVHLGEEVETNKWSRKGAASKVGGKLVGCGVLEVMRQLSQNDLLNNLPLSPIDLKCHFCHIFSHIYPGLSPDSSTLLVYSALSTNKVLNQSPPYLRQ